ncbi:hypothetical protein D3C87_1923820 [compost metagenome]
MSTHRLDDFGWVLMKSEPPPWPLMVCTTFHACAGCPAGSVPIRLMVSSPRWLVAQTGPNFGCMKLAPRPGCGVLPTSISAASLSSLVSTTAILSDALAATRK